MTHDEFLAARNTLGLTQAQMGAKLRKSKSQIKRYESGRHTIPFAVAVTVHWFLVEHSFNC